MEKEEIDKNGISELEKVIKKAMDLTICPIPKSECELKSDYWRCYTNDYMKCGIYRDYINKWG